ncbi:Urease alpha subunit [Microcystis aeruginosa NIES-98]|jgi:urease subunit alpha|nr:Urease alpha subunit [Microcystis aeruginosa NIES-98]
MRAMFASFGIAITKTSLTFVSKYAVKAGIPEKLKLKKNRRGRVEYAQYQ